MAVSSVTKTLKHRLNLIQILTSLFPIGKVTIPANQLQLTLDGRHAKLSYLNRTVRGYRK